MSPARGSRLRQSAKKNVYSFVGSGNARPVSEVDRAADLGTKDDDLVAEVYLGLGACSSVSYSDVFWA